MTRRLGLLTCLVAGLGAFGCSDDTTDPIVAGAAGETGGGGTGGAATGGGGTGGGGTGGSNGCGTPNPALMGTDGYIQDYPPTGTTGIMGAWYTYGCTGATFTPPNGAQVLKNAENQICFAGQVPAVVGGDFATYYGAAISFDLCATPEDTSFLPPPRNGWTPTTKFPIGNCGVSLDTISFNVTGTVPSGGIRVVFKEDGRDESPFLTAAGAGCFSGTVADANLSYNPNAPPLDKTKVVSIALQISSIEAAPIDFDFCISDLSIQ
jgi:hypothetical protein